ncbi:MAG: hypothetical protein ACE5ES_04135 [Candidatus Nanoarchaeia archaeon]
MKNPTNIILKASKRVLDERKYVKILFVSMFVFLAIFILLPVIFTPGNTIAFQLTEVFTYWNYVLMIFLSFSIGLMISMQVYSYNLKKSAKDTGRGVVGGFSGFVAGIFGTAACSSCVAAIFGFLGLGTVFFLVEYQWYIVGGSVLLVFISIYLTSLGIEKKCNC